MVDEVVIRPRLYRNLPLGLCLLSVLLFGLVLAATDAGRWLWLGVILYAWLVAFWARAALRTYVRCDGRGVRSPRPLSKLTASASWDEIDRFIVASRGVVKAELRGGDPVVVLDRSGDGQLITQRLEGERARRQ